MPRLVVGKLEVELIIGKQPPVAALGANEAQNRFYLVFGNFIHVFCDRDHPLTLFLDDLQWADLATLKLMERMLVEEQTQYLFLLGAYRDNEVSVSHPLAMSLEKLRKNSNAVSEITLNPLTLDQITDLIGDTLQQSPETVVELGELLREKTGENPFFIKEFLQALHDENLLKFHQKSRSWRWSMADIKGRNFTDNVVELMVEKLQHLPAASQEILSIAACLGAEFDLKILTWIAEKSASEIFASLKSALDLGLIFSRSELDENLLIQSYKFNHDRIQQAAYSLISDRQKQEFNLQIGRLLLANLDPKERGERIFDIVDRLNAGRSLIADELERLELVKLNLWAGKKAKDATAYPAAREYLKIGLEELTENPENAWFNQYNLAFSLYKELGLLEYLNGNLTASEAIINEALSRVNSALDRAEIYNLLIIQYTMMAKYSDAIEIGRKALALFGIDLPKTDLKNALLQEVERVKKNLGNREVASLLYEPENKNPEPRMVQEILVNIDLPTYFFDQELYSVVVVKMVNHSLTYGNIAESAKGYVAYGIILSSVLRDYPLAYEFGCLAVKVSDRFHSQSQKCSSCMVLAGHINHWVKHIKYAKELFDDAYHVGLSSGELRDSGYALEHQLRYLFYQGVNLQEILELLPKYLQFLQQTKNQWGTDGMLGFQLALLNLLGGTCSPLDFNAEHLSENEYLENCRAHNSFAWLCTFNILKSQVLYLHAQFEKALEAALEAERSIHFVLSQFQSSESNFHYSLILAALYPDATEENQQKYWRQLEINQKQMKIWADCCPENFLHKFLLISAEMARISGQDLEALELYDRAIDSARENEFIQNEALGNELAAKFWLAKRKEKIARVYMMEAYYCYSRWGATAKVKHLEKKHPQLLQSPPTNTNISTTLNTHMGTDYTDSVDLDLATTIKSTNAISSEIVLEKLLATLMDILVENAGAQRGILILPRGEDLFVEATKEADSENVSVLQSLPMNQFARLSLKVVHYVARTQETIVLNDAIREGNFTDDSYIQKYQCQSIACTPLINQGKLQGIIYLENNLSAGAFTRERMALLRTLATQAAISLENARLYDACKRFVPDQFLGFLNKKSIVEVQLGDQVEGEMTVLFSDIRNFTAISEQMLPAENFAFINEYLGYMEPQIQRHDGFIDKYIGDAIMALFPNSADDGVISCPDNW